MGVEFLLALTHLLILVKILFESLVAAKLNKFAPRPRLVKAKKNITSKVIITQKGVKMFHQIKTT